MRLFRRNSPSSDPDPLLGTGSGPIRTKHGHRVNFAGGCSGDGLGDPSFCQAHLADWQRGEQQCDAALAYAHSK